MEISLGSWQVPALFKYVASCANIEEEDLFATFNMGIGLIMIVSREETELVMELIRQGGETPCVIGKVVEGKGVSLC